MAYKFLLVFGSLSEPYTFFGPYDSQAEAYDAASSTHAVGAGYRAYTCVPVLSPDDLMHAAGAIPKVDANAVEAQERPKWDWWGSKLSASQAQKIINPTPES